MVLYMAGLLYKIAGIVSSPFLVMFAKKTLSNKAARMRISSQLSHTCRLTLLLLFLFFFPKTARLDIWSQLPRVLPVL